MRLPLAAEFIAFEKARALKGEALALGAPLLEVPAGFMALRSGDPGDGGGGSGTVSRAFKIKVCEEPGKASGFAQAVPHMDVLASLRHVSAAMEKGACQLISAGSKSSFLETFAASSGMVSLARKIELVKTDVQLGIFRKGYDSCLSCGELSKLHRRKGKDVVCGWPSFKTLTCYTYRVDFVFGFVLRPAADAQWLSYGLARVLHMLLHSSSPEWRFGHCL